MGDVPEPRNVAFSSGHDAPAGGSSNLPVTPNTAASRPTSRRRRRGTGNRPASSRPMTATTNATSSARPGTTASTISDLDMNDLPDREFYPEGEDFDEDEEYDDDELEEDVFAFERPVTGAAPRVAFSDATPSTRHNTGAPATGTTHVSGGTFGLLRRSSEMPMPDVTCNVDAGAHVPELTYDKANPPPMSGRDNPNNSSFAFMNKLNAEKQKHRPPTGRSLLSRLQRRQTTASTDGASTTQFSSTSLDSPRGDESDGGSFTTELTGSARPTGPKRVKSTAPLIPSTAGGVSEYNSEYTSGLTSEAGTSRRGMSRGSYGMTEFSGEMTVPDGKTTWGDGQGGVLKEGSEADSNGPAEYDLAEEDSPYPEVRASVSNIDDPDMPALTIRSWCLGIALCILTTAANTFFHFRTPAPYISPFMIQVAAYPMGKFLAWIVPIWSWTVPSWLGGWEINLNPGPFNIKEHTLIVIMANVGTSPAYSLYAIVSSELWYAHDFGIGFSILFTISTQLTGFTFAGLCRRFVVWPASMIWPQVLVAATLLNTFHAEDEGFRGGMSRMKFLFIAGGCAFAYYFLPGFLFTALSYFSYACWIAPNNAVVNELFGVSTGLGYGMLTFDWLQVSWIGNPLATPWWAQVNWLCGFLLFYWILVPIFYYANVWYTAFLPVNVIQAADRFGQSYDIFNILTPDIELNLTAYKEYSPVYLSASFNMTFMLAFALATGIIVHTALHHGPRIYRAVLNIKTEVDDIHMKLMRQYPEVPDWWYGALFVFCFMFAVLAMELYHTDLPIWGYVISIALPFLYILPAAFIFAMTSQSIAINLIAELIPGYIFAGKPIPGMIFKTFSVQTVTVGLTFISDQKLGHYMKVPPRHTFIAQLSAALICGLIQIATKTLLFASVEDICGSQQKNLLTCANTKVFFTSTIIWGLIGPGRLFSKGYMYHPQVWALLIGAVIPIPLWFYVRKWPRSFLRNMNIPVILNGGFSIPPATGVNYSSFFIVGFVFQYLIRRRRFAWWSKYNYILSVALDVGSALSALFIFLVLDLTNAKIDWWGNNVYQKTADWNGEGAAYYAAPETGFGPDTW